MNCKVSLLPVLRALGEGSSTFSLRGRCGESCLIVDGIDIRQNVGLFTYLKMDCLILDHDRQCVLVSRL